MPLSHVTVVDCPECNGTGTVYGPYRGVAGCETQECRCERCDGDGIVAVEDDDFADEGVSPA